MLARVPWVEMERGAERRELAETRDPAGPPSNDAVDGTGSEDAVGP